MSKDLTKNNEFWLDYDGKKFKLDDLTYQIRSHSFEGIHPYKRQVLTVYADPVSKTSKEYLKIKRELRDDWSLDVLDSDIETTVKIMQALGIHTTTKGRNLVQRSKRTTKGKKSNKKQENFPDRVRFNWGYWDAVQCVKEGWDKNGQCFFGILGKNITPEKVIKEHPDKAYAFGWAYGYEYQKGGKSGTSSDDAWLEFTKTNHSY